MQERLPRLEWVEEAAAGNGRTRSSAGMRLELRAADDLRAGGAGRVAADRRRRRGLGSRPRRRARGREPPASSARARFDDRGASADRPRGGGGAVVARIDGPAVAAAGWTPVVHGVSEIVGVATAEAAPRRLAGVVTAAAARGAFAAGAALCVLSPGDDAAQRVYARAGFALAATILHWSDPHPAGPVANGRMAAAIALEGVTKLYGKQRGVLDLSLEVASERCSATSASTAPKSTTIRLLLDLICPRAARSGCSVAMRDATAERPTRSRLLSTGRARALRAAYRRRAAHVRLAAARRPRPRLRARAPRTRFELDLDAVRSGRFPRGNKQKVGLVQAFVGRPELIVLDEPSSGLDPLMQRTFEELVRETASEGRTVFLSSHVLSEVQEMADRVGIIREGRLVAVEGVRALHSRRVRRFEIRFADGVPRDALERLQGIRELHVDGPVARLPRREPRRPRQGAREPHLVDLTSHEPDLEDVFLSYYTDAEQRSGERLGTPGAPSPGGRSASPA